MNALEKQIYETEAQLQKLQAELDKQKKPEAPFWGWFDTSTNGRNLYRITNNKTNLWHFNRGKTEMVIYCDCFDHLATPEEIKEHLVKLAKEKYKEGDLIKWLEWSGRFNSKSLEYRPEGDLLFFTDFYGIQIYNQGKWAEIVPSLPSWGELGMVEVYKVGTSNTKNYINHVQKIDTFTKLLAVADYVNEGWEADWNNVQIKYEISCSPTINPRLFSSDYGLYSTSHSPVYFKSRKAAEKAIKIFKANGSEQELINFFK